MILIDTTKQTNNIVFSSNKHNDSKSFLLKFKSDSEQTNHQIILAGNLSEFVERNFLYEVHTNLFNDLTAGFYTYEISLSDTLEVVTYGNLCIKKPIVSDYIQPESDVNQDYIIYNG